ncbi:MAG TPA: ATP-binding protein [Gammaproteobacteria bacterium]|nr:ATP-binding protein [Gammaproteobacteria bacterium]
MPEQRPAAPGPRALPPEALYLGCEDSLSFVTTADLPDLDGAIGQGRALAALEFGVRMRSHGYNLFVLGRSGSQRRLTAESSLRADAAQRGVAPEWCYVDNFAEERKPFALQLPAGRGAQLRRDMTKLVEELGIAIPAAFESERYRNSFAEINQDLEERHRVALESLTEEARRQDLSLVPTPHGFAIAPVKNGELLADEEFEKLPPEEREATRQRMQQMTEKLRQHIEQLPRWRKEQRERIVALNREVTKLATGQLIEQLKGRYVDLPDVLRYLVSVGEDVLQNARSFLPEDTAPLPTLGMRDRRPLTRYEVNLLVDRSGQKEAPIVYESNPSVQNLLGRVDHVAEFGALSTNFTMIRPGALHRANGGYLILDADRLLMEPLAWRALKRTLFAREIRIESLGELLSLVSTVSLEPQTIPLDVKIILIGERQIYYLLAELDPDFAELFKVAADFENSVERTPENTALYSRLIATLARRDGLRPLDRGAVARVIEHGARLLGDAAKLTTRLRDINDLLREANYWAQQEGGASVSRHHVQAAIDAQIQRLDRLRDESHQGITRNLRLIDTGGAVVGQVNGLSVFMLGSFSFGEPARITANVRLGDGEIVDIERETELGGPIHSKGVLILSSYLAARYAAEMPLSLRASLVFEQSYGGVEGDSASVAETCALLSALAGVPIRQSLAVTGSLNQHGRVQVIGGVNEKIEGFFDVCRSRGLDGSHGVLIPAENVQHLMLRDDVVAAVRAGKFNVYPIASVDEALELLTGVPAGQRDADGAYAEGTVNRRVQDRLQAFVAARRRFEHPQEAVPPWRRRAAARTRKEGE